MPAITIFHTISLLGTGVSVLVETPDSGKIEHEACDWPGPCDFVCRLRANRLTGFINQDICDCMEVIRFGTQKASGTQEPLGTLRPGEFVSIPIGGISGVFASCEKESTVCCLIK